MKSHRRLLSLFVLVTLLPVAAQAAEPHDAIKPVPRSGGWMKRHESFNARVAQGNVDLIFIGDSITQGWERNGKNVWAKFYDKRNAVNTAKQALPEDPGVTQRKAVLAEANKAISEDPHLVQLRSDVKFSQEQLKNRRLTTAQDLTWALINSPSFLFNR